MFNITAKKQREVPEVRSIDTFVVKMCLIKKNGKMKMHCLSYIYIIIKLHANNTPKMNNIKIEDLTS